MKFAVKLLAGVFATAVLFVTQLPGQEMIKPGPEHKFLAEVEGRMERKARNTRRRVDWQMHL